MNTLKLGTYENKTSFRPGEKIAGKVLWLLDKAPKAVEVRLFWFTQGKGTSDVSIVASARFDHPGARGEGEFAFPAPASPSSFSGKLISLTWALEAESSHPDLTERVEITLSPTGCEVFLEKGKEVEVADESAGQPVQS